MSGSRRPASIGILYCGDLGVALARLLKKSGNRVVTTCEARSARTRASAVAAGVEILPTLDDVLNTADMVISVVLPEAAQEVASRCADRQQASGKSCLYVDANSLDLDTLSAIQAMLDQSDIRFVDAAIHGGAARLEELGVLYLSGIHAPEVEAAFRSVMRTCLLGDELGQATRMKLLMAGISKGLNVLFVEIAGLARKAELLDPFLAECRGFYPGMMTAIERMLPTYPQHAPRRAKELQSIEELARSLGASHEMVHAARKLLQTVGGRWCDPCHAEAPWDIPRLIEVATAVTSSTDAGKEN